MLTVTCDSYQLEFPKPGVDFSPSLLRTENIVKIMVMSNPFGNPFKGCNGHMKWSHTIMYIQVDTYTYVTGPAKINHLSTKNRRFCSSLL